MNIPCTTEGCANRMKIGEARYTEAVPVPHMVNRTVRYPYCEDCWRKRQGADKEEWL